LLVMVAWVLCIERYAITECLVVSQAAGVWEHSAFHRVFARRRWEVDALGRLWLLALVARLHRLGVRLQFVVDDTLGTHKGPKVFGLGTHLDAVRSTRKTKVFAFGHVWVTLALVVTVPFARRPFALPLLFRLYRGKKECAAHGGTYATKTALARELVDCVCAWVPTAAFDLLLDSGYANQTVLRDLPTRVCVLAAIDVRAALTDVAGRTLRTGRHSPKGDRLPSLRTWAADAATPWTTTTADVYGGARDVTFKTQVAQWWRVLGARPVRIVLLHCATGTVALRAFLCTDPERLPTTVLSGYARRWSIECFFFEGKQFLGLCASRAWTELAVRRLTPCLGLLYGVLVVWFWDQSAQGLQAVLPNRPWYGQKEHVSFQDILRTVRVALSTRPVLDQVTEVAPLRRAVRRRASRPTSSARIAA
jgi:hypothetical protein